MRRMGQLYTLGYSGLEIDGFLALVADHKIDVICDVRSTPYSTYKPDFTRAAFKRHLNAADVKYVFLGDKLGARPNDRSCYVDGQAIYDKIAQTAPFKEGMARVRKGVETLNLALVCSERDPIECHRTILVVDRLIDLRASTTHIHTDGSAETQEAFDARLVEKHGLTPPPLLREPGDWNRAVVEAYEKQSAAIAYREREWPADVAAE
jgi:uncharacterized protein (DUF488 family)